MTPPPDVATGAELNTNGPAAASTSRWANSSLGRQVNRLPYAHKLPQVMRYAAVSGVSTVISQSVLASLVFTRTLSPGWANVVAVCIGTVPSFELNRRWVWGHDERRLFAHATPFAALSFLGLGISTFTVHFAGIYALHHHLSPVPRTLLVNASSLAAFGTLWIAQFVILDRLMFGKKPKAGGDQPESKPHDGTASGFPASATTTSAAPADAVIVTDTRPAQTYRGRVLDKA